ncbi:MAG TPA: hypothetical protein VKB24_00880 [Candidatus Acidoferrum sp.]|nr:hypothetical protein [Candidatus Acidoferrum sp.]
MMPSVHKILPSLAALLILLPLLASAGCENKPAAKQSEAADTAKPAEPAVPPEIQAAADGSLGSETTVLAYGDLAKTGTQQILIGNVLPKTPKDNITGTIVSRAAIIEKQKDQWVQIFLCDEYLKNSKGYLGMTPIEPVSGWRIQHEQDPVKGLTVYFTPVKGIPDLHVLPIAVQWNPKTKRYQSLDRSYQQFLLESPALSNVRTRLR